MHDSNYTKSLLYLSYLIMHADGLLDDAEARAIDGIREKENIDKDEWNALKKEANGMREKDIYYRGLEHIMQCSDEQKIRIFAWLHKITDSDGNVHVKEIRFLLYSLKKVGIEMDDVIAVSKTLPEV